jgi:hypothetical protein
MVSKRKSKSAQKDEEILPDEEEINEDFYEEELGHKKQKSLSKSKSFSGGLEAGVLNYNDLESCSAGPFDILPNEALWGIFFQLPPKVCIDH